jgi:hypothetical protein
MFIQFFIAYFLITDSKNYSFLTLVKKIANISICNKLFFFLFYKGSDVLDRAFKIHHICKILNYRLNLRQKCNKNIYLF